MNVRPIQWRDGKLILLDQTRLPAEEVYLEFSDHCAVATAITDMVVRGAPAIGVTAAYGVVLAARERATAGAPLPDLADACERLAAARPTAVNLFWALERMRRCLVTVADLPAPEAVATLEAEARAIEAEDIANNRKLGHFGAELLPDPCTLLTHCNAGALATAGYGTALGVVRAAVEQGKSVHVFADETRPFLQGSRLTAWELHRDGIAVTLLCDNMAGYRLSLGGINAVVVGADRIAANGDVANKIGTYPLSLLAREHGVPFYVAAPLSTVDFKARSGADIPIEQRDPGEITHLGENALAPAGVTAWNPAFDVTPARCVSAIITEAGVLRPPYTSSLAAVRGAA